MKLLTKLKTFCYKNKVEKRYKKVKECNLPFPFSDDKREVFEWVYFDKENCCFNNRNDLIDSLPVGGVIYHYEVIMPDWKDKKPKLITSHGHSFEDVLKVLYEYPESFNIPDDFKCEYSKQELELIKENQNYFKLIGLKDYKKSKELQDLDDKWEKLNGKKHKTLRDRYFLFRYYKLWKKQRDKDNLKRYNNKKHDKYNKCYIKHWSNEAINAVFNKEKTNIISRKFSFSSSMKGTKYLLVDEEHNFKGVIEIIKDNFIKFNELNDGMVYIPKKYKNFNSYKKWLKEDLIKEGQAYNEEFSDESIINCAEFKVIEKF